MLSLALLAAGCGGRGAEARAASASPGAGARRAAPAPMAPRAQPGDMALDYIAQDTYRSLVIEVAWTPGAEPSPGALQRVREIFARRLDKPEGVEIQLAGAVTVEKATPRWQTGDLLALELEHRRTITGAHPFPSRASIWVIYVGGESEGDEGGTRALGLAYDASSIAVFRGSIDRTTRPEVRELVETMVLVHEGGHLFGLVNNGVPMVNRHEDPLNPRHDVNPSCVMHHRIETSDVTRLLERPAIDFDYQCRLDLFVAGGLAPGDPETPLVSLGGRVE